MEDRASERLEILREAVRVTFETITFSEAADWETLPSWPGDAGNHIGSVISLQKPVRGEFSLFLDSGQCREFVETAYGPEVLESPENEGMIRDFMNELVNTIAGRFAAALAEGGKDIRLGLPSAAGSDSMIPGENPAGILIGFTLDGTRAFMRLKT